MATAMDHAIKRTIQILDGGMSRELMRLGAPFTQPEWSAQALLETPHLVEQVHREFAAAGADILTTNTYALVPFHIGPQRFWERGGELASLAGRLARNAADEERSRTGREVLVAGSLPPIFGSYRPDLFRSAEVQPYLELLVNAMDPFVDVWLGETLSLTAEAEAVAVAVARTNKPFWISFHLNEHPDEGSVTSHLLSGEPVVHAVRKVLDLGAEGVLFNCNVPEVMHPAIIEAVAVVKEQQQSRHISIGVYANAFKPQDDEKPAANERIRSTRSDLQIQTYVASAHEWIQSGATIVGGCCGIGADYIGELARQFKDVP